MKTFQSILVASGFVALASASVNPRWSNVTYTTEVVTAYTTYCPAPTVINHGNKTYTVTEATTLTITDCPCTITKPVTPTSPPLPPPVYPTGTGVSPPISPPASSSAVVPVVYTTTVVTAYTTYCPSPTTITQGTHTYTVTAPTSLTITDCPCTLMTTVPPSTYTIPGTIVTTYCPSPTTITIDTSSTVVVPSPGTFTITYPASVVTSPPKSASTAPFTTTVTASKISSTTSSPALFTPNAGNKLGSGLGAIMVGAVAAFVL